MADPRRAHRGAAALLSALTLAGCGGGDETVERGYLLDDGTGLRICEAIAESFPPQCGGRSLRVRGELPDVEWTEAQGVRWTDAPVELRGTVEDGVLVLER